MEYERPFYILGHVTVPGKLPGSFVQEKVSIDLRLIGAVIATPENKARIVVSGVVLTTDLDYDSVMASWMRCTDPEGYHAQQQGVVN